MLVLALPAPEIFVPAQFSVCSQILPRFGAGIKKPFPPVRFHFPLCDFILAARIDSRKQAQRAAVLLPISFSRSCAPVTFPDSRSSGQGQVFLPVEATAAGFDLCRHRQDLDFISFCSFLMPWAKLLRRWLSSG
jgi:hypothetical protein